MISNSFNVWVVIAPCIGFAVIAGADCCAILLKKKKLHNDQNKTFNQTETKSEINQNEEEKLLSSLSERELKVVELTINLKRRKDIAGELCFSENTIKKDLTSIYSKLKVKDKSELIAKYKDLI